MAPPKSPRKGSLQFWPRKRAKKFLPSVNWRAIPRNISEKGLRGFICYKVGMKTALVNDNSPDSMTQGKRIAVPITIIECPPMKILSVRFYKNNIVAKDVLAENLDKEIKKKIKIPKKSPNKIDGVKLEDYDDIKIICYSLVKKTAIKKKPDLAEIDISGSLEEKLNFVKENLNKELSILSFFENGQLVDFRGLTKGKGFQGPVKRFGIRLRSHKSEKGIRKVGSIGPWHPAHVSFRVAMAGQLGFFTRVLYNNKIIYAGKISDDKYKDKLKNIKNYGNVKTDYVIVKGSVQGPAKRQLLISNPLRETKRTKKKNYEFVELN
ncbi:MAG TPA: 50S ribosomal protein L3 [Candidatus Nanoarchaeia archaeon]|nr:50S ribosomal protein L3 [Candidatus Nanoarchaeia archaeon]